MKSSSQLRVMIKGGNFRGKGAEAMMSVVHNAIIDAFPGAICMAIVSSEAERIRFLESGIKPMKQLRVNKLRMPFFLFHALSSRLLKRRAHAFDSGNEAPLFSYNMSNVVVDISGFASSDQFGWKKSYSRFYEMCLAWLYGNRILYMPQSWGPFHERAVRFFTKWMLKHAEIVFARERQSFDFLMEASCSKPDRVLISPDIAFHFRASRPSEAKSLLKQMGVGDDRNMIAVTPNMRIYERTQGVEGENVYVKEMLQVIDILGEHTACNILLLPHEATRDKANDFELCQMIAKSVKARNRVFVLSGKETAAEAKAIIGLCEFSVLSRYHSLIAALSMRVPVVVIGWSHKYDDVMKEVGLEEWVVDPVRRPGRSIADLVVDGWEQRAATRALIEQNVLRLESGSRFAVLKMIATIQKTYED